MLSEDEISESLNPHKNLDDAQIKEKLREMIEWNKQRMETDNISAIYIKLK
jgi:serine/threonine protein phosphatase PrpC